MYKAIKVNGHIAYGIKEFICDSKADLYRIQDYSFGDTCLIIEDGLIYIANSKGEWLIMGRNNNTPEITSTTSIIGEGVIGEIIIGKE